MGRLCFFCPALCPAGILYAMLSLQPHKLMWSRTSERKNTKGFFSLMLLKITVQALQNCFISELGDSCWLAQGLDYLSIRKL